MNLTQYIEDYVNRSHWPQLNSVLVWQNSTIIAENYFNGFDADSRHIIMSVAKSILSIGIGIAADKGLIKLDDPIAKYLPEFAEQRDPRHRVIKIRHLLTMTSGIAWKGGVHYHCPMMEQMWKSGNVLEYIADCPVTKSPGSCHNYSEFDVLLLGAVLDHITGDCYTFIEKELFKPLGINGTPWFRSKCGVTYSVGDLNEGSGRNSALSARDLSKIGVLYLHGGIWENKQILSKEYIAECITPSIADPGYGYLWWIGSNWYGCRGFGGQSITVFPSKELVIVTQATPTARPLSYEIMWDIEKLL